ncbi:MAG: HlyD family efflux transporter periplasmic adaptor subunit [Pseudomonadota bacterium]
MVEAKDPNLDVAPESMPVPQQDSNSAELPLVVVDRSRQQADIPPSSRSTTPRSFRLIGLVIVIVLSIVAGGIIGLYRQPPGLQWVMNTLGLTPGGGTSTPIAVPVARPPSSPAASTQATGIVALGRLIPAGEVVTVAPSSGVRDARIAELRVAEGDTVERGQILAVLDSEPRLASAVTSARTLVAVREATVLQTRASVRASLVEAQASLSRAEAAALRARQDFERTERLFKRNIVAKATYDQRVATLREADKEVERQKATVSRYESQDLSSQPDVIVAIRNVEAAKADLKRAVEDLEQAYVRAPIAGTVLEINARTGEKPGDSGVLELGNVAKMMAEVEVYQSQIGKVAIGDPVTLSAAALPETLSGTVTRIGLKVKRQSAIGQDPAANTDARVVEVIVALNKASSQIASRFTDLQVEARIETGNRP